MPKMEKKAKRGKVKGGWGTHVGEKHEGRGAGEEPHSEVVALMLTPGVMQLPLATAMPQITVALVTC